MRPVFRDGKVHVCAERCASCIFRPGNLMHLNPGRVKDLVDQALSSDAGSITCHDTLDADQAICFGFWDGYRDRVQLLQVAERIEIVEYVPITVKE